MEFNLNRESHKIHNKKVNEQIEGISKWIESVGGKDSKEAVNFIYKYLSHLNNNTKKSMYEHLLDITNTRFVEINKQNDLMLLLNDLLKLIQQIKTL